MRHFLLALGIAIILGLTVLVAGTMFTVEAKPEPIEVQGYVIALQYEQTKFGDVYRTTVYMWNREPLVVREYLELKIGKWYQIKTDGYGELLYLKSRK